MGLRPLALWRAGPLAHPPHPPPPPVEETHRLTGYLSADQAGWTALALSPPRFRPIAADSTHTHTHTHAHVHTVPSSQARPRRPLYLRQRLGVARVPGSTAARPPALAPQPPPATPGRKQRALGTTRHQPPHGRAPFRPAGPTSPSRARGPKSPSRARSRATPHCARPPASGGLPG